MLADRVNDTTTHFLVLTPYKSRSTRSTRPKAILRLSLGVSIMKMTESMTQQRISWSWHLTWTDLRKNMSNSCCSCYQTGKPLSGFLSACHHENDMAERREAALYIPYLFCQLCSDSSVRPLWGAEGWRSGWALASPQCDPGSNPGINTICGLGLLLVLSLALRGFSLGNSGFPLSLKPTFSNFSSTRNGSRTTTLYQLSC